MIASRHSNKCKQKPWLEKSNIVLLARTHRTALGSSLVWRVLNTTAQ